MRTSNHNSCGSSYIFSRPHCCTAASCRVNLVLSKLSCGGFSCRGVLLGSCSAPLLHVDFLFFPFESISDIAFLRIVFSGSGLPVPGPTEPDDCDSFYDDSLRATVIRKTEDRQGPRMSKVKLFKLGELNVNISENNGSEE